MRRIYAVAVLVPLLAAPLTAGAEAAGIFGAFQDAITAPDAGFLANSLALGNEIFATIFLAYVIIGLCKATLTNNFDQFWWNIATVVFKMIGPLAALNFAHIILPDLVGFVNFFIGRITGLGAGAGGADALVGLGLTTMLALIHASTASLSTPDGVLGAVANPANIPLAIMNVVLAFVAGVACYFSFVYVAIELVLAWYKTLLASSVGAASVGFFGSEATSDMAFRYTSGVVSGIWTVILLTIWPYTVFAVFTSFNFTASIAAPGKFLTTTIEVTVFSLVVIFATLRIVRIAESMFSGQVGFAMGDITRTVSAAVTAAVKAAKVTARA